MSESKELPKYALNLKVRAVKIAAIEFDEHGIANIAPDNELYSPFKTKGDYRTEFFGIEDLGYYVLNLRSEKEQWLPSSFFEKYYEPLEGLHAQ